MSEENGPSNALSASQEAECRLAERKCTIIIGRGYTEAYRCGLAVKLTSMLHMRGLFLKSYTFLHCRRHLAVSFDDTELLVEVFPTSVEDLEALGLPTPAQVWVTDPTPPKEPST